MGGRKVGPRSAEDQGERLADGRPAQPVRLQRFLAQCDVASRRGSERLISAGRVCVNGCPASVGVSVDPERDRVTVDGFAVSPSPRRTVLLHKPPGVTCTLQDPHASRCLPDLLAPDLRSLFPVGRLDRDTEGVLLLTNDGTLSHALTHPSFQIERVYQAEVGGGQPGREELDALRRGVRDGGETLSADAARWISAAEGEAGILEVVLHRGRKHEVRRMLAAVGHPVRRLVRVRFGPVRLGNLPSGETRDLGPGEGSALARIRRRSLGLSV